jgi:hypothetical protein
MICGECGKPTYVYEESPSGEVLRTEFVVSTDRDLLLEYFETLDKPDGDSHSESKLVYLADHDAIVSFFDRCNDDGVRDMVQIIGYDEEAEDFVKEYSRLSRVNGEEADD